VINVVQAAQHRDQKIALSMKVVNQSTGDDLDPTHEQSDTAKDSRSSGGGALWGGFSSELQAPEVFTVHRGKVTKVEEFGAFIVIPGYRKQGLVHKSQLAAYRVESVADAVAVGDSVWVKVSTTITLLILFYVMMCSIV
jgi:polyribonucleotide nucleotidyltransferase